MSRINNKCKEENVIQGMDSYCRTCMCQVIGNTNGTAEAINIFQTKDFVHKLMACSSLRVEQYDGYPCRVCDKCFKTVLNFADFQQMCHDTLDKFNRMLENSLERKSEVIILESNANSTASVCGILDQLEMKHEENDPLLTTTNIMQEWNISLKGPTSCVRKKRGRPSRNLKMEDNSNLKMKQIVNEEDETEEDEAAFSKKFNEGMTRYGHKKCDVGDKLLNLSNDEGSISDTDSASRPCIKQKTCLGLPFRCKTCAKKFRFQHRLDAHIRRHQGQRGYPCTRDNCERTFNRLSYLQQHLNDHDGVPRTIYKCDWENCEQAYSCQSGLRAHKRKCHSGKPHKPEVHMCETCGAVLTSLRSLRDHRFIHMDKAEWPFVCDVAGCSKRFRILHQLKIHKKRHAGIKNYACPHCDMRFVTRTNMKNHINHHTWEKTWSCDFCPKVCNTPAVLRAHIQNKHLQRASVDPENVIKRPRRFQCSFCDRAFLTADGKKYHELIHTGEKPHVCDECGKKFRQPAGLKTHMRTHVKDAPRAYVCGICGRAYFTSQTLRHHEMKHTGEKPYKCAECNLSFRWPNNLTRHQRLHQRDCNTDVKSTAT